jgi:hypothetical protein
MAAPFTDVAIWATLAEYRAKVDDDIDPGAQGAPTTI